MKDFIKLISNTFWEFVDNRYVVRRVVLGVTIWMSYHAYLWAAHFAELSTKPGMEIAAIIAAVVTPISALQGFIFKLYLENKGER